MDGPNAHPAAPTMIGNYPVERELGRGGMGVVYLARDPRLNRQVAVKVLPAEFVRDPMRLQRFEREARTLAALNHRNVAMIFGLEDASGERLLILEFVPGVTLTQRLSRGPMSAEDAIRTGIQICEGLEAAHERDVIHRDLKPDNIKITPDGLVKVLDFGLATTRTQERDSASSSLTQAGMVMGTPGYMSPEQARGLPTDKRTDIWALGCVLFECVTGYKAFGGETVSDCIAAILSREPDFSLLPPKTPARLRELLRRCFVKDQRRRIRDIGDARIELEEILIDPTGAAAGSSASVAQKPQPTARLLMPLTGMASVAGAAQSAPATSGLHIINSSRGSIAVAPDNSCIVFVGSSGVGTQLFVRRLDTGDVRPIPGTQGADAPFFSTDSTKVGFFAEGKLKRVTLAGGMPLTLAPAPRPQGGCYDSTDTIYYIADWQKSLLKISDSGAPGAMPEPVVQPDIGAGELALVSPEVLPGSRHVLMSIWTGRTHDDSVISAIDLRTGIRRTLIQGGSNPRFLSSGHLVYSRAGALMAVGFDPEQLQVFGLPQLVEDRILGNALGGGSQFGISPDGLLAYAPGSVWEPKGSIVVTGRPGAPAGEAIEITGEQRAFAAPTVSQDGRLLCVQVQGSTDHLWLYELDHPGAAGLRLTFHADNSSPVFSPDGKRLAFRSNMSGVPEIYMMHIGHGGGSSPEPVFGSDRSPTPCGFSPDGQSLLFTQSRTGGTQGALEVWIVEIGRPETARVLLQSPTSCWGATISPDGKLIAYVSDETGRPEVFVQGYPVGFKRQVSTDGGNAPLWNAAGNEIFFRSADSVIGVRVATEPSFMLGRSRVIMQAQGAPATPTARNYAMLADNQFLFVRAQGDPSRVQALNVVLNWTTELRKRVPTLASQAQSAATSPSRMGLSSANVYATAMPTSMTPTPIRAGAQPASTNLPTMDSSTPAPSAWPARAGGSESNTIG
jgi:serine/threonine-protein kinase